MKSAGKNACIHHRGSSPGRLEAYCVVIPLLSGTLRDSTSTISCQADMPRAITINTMSGALINLCRMKLIGKLLEAVTRSSSRRVSSR